MKKRNDLLWFDGLGGLIVGAVVLLLSDWLSKWLGAPQSLLVFTGVVNLLYASYSIPLAARRTRPPSFILFLILANLMWVPVCFGLAFLHRETLTVLGFVHLIGEGIFVGVLACIEWRWRHQLQTGSDDLNENVIA